MWPKQVIRVTAPIAGALAVKHGDDFVTTKNNVQTLHEYSKALKKQGIEITPEMAEKTLTQPSPTQQTLSKGLEIAHDVAKELAKNTKPKNKP